MNIETNKPLLSFNSFGFHVHAEYFVSVRNIPELAEALQWAKQQNCSSFILGGGSNTIFTRDVSGLVIHISIGGYEKSHQSDSNFTNLKIGAGMDWHQLVTRTLDDRLFGLETLALIPGSAGAAPIQNIGAYGTEVRDMLTSVDVLEKSTGELLKLSNTDCEFGYRDSIFKRTAGNNYVVTAIHLKLSHHNKPSIKYPALRDRLNNDGIDNPDCQQVFHSVCQIRSSKLPDPAILGNAGSFFKNPVINRQQLDSLLRKHPDLPHFEQASENYKVPAAWLIDQAGWKGHRTGAVGVHSEQALVLVNHGGGDGQQIAVLAERIRHDIEQRFAISLEREPVLY